MIKFNKFARIYEFERIANITHFLDTYIIDKKDYIVGYGGFYIGFARDYPEAHLFYLDFHGLGPRMIRERDGEAKKKQIIIIDSKFDPSPHLIPYSNIDKNEKNGTLIYFRTLKEAEIFYNQNKKLTLREFDQTGLSIYNNYAEFEFWRIPGVDGYIKVI